MGTWSRYLGMQLLCGTLLLLMDAGVHARLLAEDVWGEEGMMMEVVHMRRQLQALPYCVAASNADQSKLQDALDWACGPAGSSGGGVDCSAILQTGSCYSPNTLQAHASYAFDAYYVQQGGASGSCDFNGLATPTSSDPSSGSCVYPSVGSGVSSPTSNSTTFSPPSSSTNTTFGSSTTGTTSDAMGSTIAPLSWIHTCCALLVMLLLASRL
eukprot:c14576_g2_i1 orf=166-801(+)